MMNCIVGSYALWCSQILLATTCQTSIMLICIQSVYVNIIFTVWHGIAFTMTCSIMMSKTYTSLTSVCNDDEFCVENEEFIVSPSKSNGIFHYGLLVTKAW